VIGGKLRHGVEERFEFIEFRAYWHGRLNRSDLMKRFSVSKTQTSQDFKAYQELAPGNLIYDSVEKAYRCGEDFKAVFLDASPENYLTPLLAIRAGHLNPGATSFRTIPAFHVAPTPARGVRSEILRAIVHAVDQAEAVEVRYQSMTSPEPSWRWIEPHGYAFDGFRWHIRAFCCRDETFKDFVLSRILETRRDHQGRRANTRGDMDQDWHADVVLVIGPHPGLSVSQRRAICLDYGMDEHDRVAVTVPRSMLYYALKRLGLDTDPAARRPQDQQVVLLNRAEVMPITRRWVPYSPSLKET
jgi:hypothetical protein